MTGRRPAKLRVILNPDDTTKLLLPDGVPETVEQLLDDIKKVCECKTAAPRQAALMNLTSTEDLYEHLSKSSP